MVETRDIERMVWSTRIRFDLNSTFPVTVNGALVYSISMRTLRALLSAAALKVE
jgi:hypothetical protein